MNTDILNNIDKIFDTAFKSDNPIDPKLLIGTHHPIYLEALKRYKTATVKTIQNGDSQILLIIYFPELTLIPNIRYQYGNPSLLFGNNVPNKE